jgi:glycosyltransferase involved in cell wall biosynthesis
MSESGRLKISIIVTVANFGGAQIAALRLARGLRDRGHEPNVLFLYGQTPIPEPDHPYAVLAPTAQPGILGYLRITQELFRILRRDRPSVVLTFLPLASILGQAGALLAGTQRRVVSHRNPVSTITPLLRGLDTLWAWLGIYSDVVAVSESVNRTCGTYPSRLRRRSVVVHNGLRGFRRSGFTSAEARRRFGIAEDGFTLVAVGRLAPQKNYPLMLEVMNRLDSATLLIAGDGPLKGELEDTITRLGLSSKVRLLGAVGQADIPGLLAAADLFVQTSTFEGQSNSVLEALYAGLPIVAHDIPEQRETIAEDNGCSAGVLVPLGDVDAWVAAIERLRKDPAAVIAAKAVAARQAHLFGYDAMVAGFERVLIGGAVATIKP